MSLVNDYKKQYGWRDWPTVFKSLPSLQGKTVLDLGCGIGDLAAELVAHGAYVIGVDVNEELIHEAQSRQIPNTEFRLGDLRKSYDFGIAADGLWCSFAAAYFPDLPTVLTEWVQNLKPEGWIALTEIDDLFGHEPLSDRTKALLKTYTQDALIAGRYDFYMGRKLQEYLLCSSFTVLKVLQLEDQEFSFSGSATLGVLDSWRSRFNRMKLLHNFCGSDYEQVQEEFLHCLTRNDHISTAKVYFCFATQKDSEGGHHYG